MSPKAHFVPALAASSLPAVKVQAWAGPWGKQAATMGNARSKEKERKSQELQPGSPQPNPKRNLENTERVFLQNTKLAHTAVGPLEVHMQRGHCPGLQFLVWNVYDRGRASVRPLVRRPLQLWVINSPFLLSQWSVLRKGRKLCIKATHIMHAVLFSPPSKGGKLEFNWFLKLFPCKQKMSSLEDFSVTVPISPRRAENPLLGRRGLLWTNTMCYWVVEQSSSQKISVLSLCIQEVIQSPRDSISYFHS